MSDGNNVQIFQLHGREYELHKLPATKAVLLITRLSQLFGDSLIRVVVAASGAERAGNQNGNEQPELEKKDISPEQLEAFTSKLDVFSKLKDDDVLDLARIVFPYVLLANAQLYKGNDLDIDLKFAGFELDLLPALGRAISYNLGPFIEGFQKRFPKVSIPATGLSPLSPPT